jgi:hypothetical protein
LTAAALLDADGADLIGALQTWQPTACLLFDASGNEGAVGGRAVSLHRF